MCRPGRCALSSIRIHTADSGQTRAVASAVAAQVRAGDLLLLCGDLGVGKTAFAQGFGAELGVRGPMRSPTFTLANRHEGTGLVVNHLDVYRLDQMSEVLDLDLPELIDDRAVTLIEWGDAIAPTLPNDYLVVHLSFGEGDDERRIELICQGESWQERHGALAAATASWAGPC